VGRERKRVYLDALSARFQVCDRGPRELKLLPKVLLGHAESTASKPYSAAQVLVEAIFLNLHHV
jgi:hypothetical protein